jgi:hypothetical protein
MIKIYSFRRHRVPRDDRMPLLDATNVGDFIESKTKFH